MYTFIFDLGTFMELKYVLSIFITINEIAVDDQQSGKN